MSPLAFSSWLQKDRYWARHWMRSGRAGPASTGRHRFPTVRRDCRCSFPDAEMAGRVRRLFQLWRRSDRFEARLDAGHDEEDLSDAHLADVLDAFVTVDEGFDRRDGVTEFRLFGFAGSTELIEQPNNDAVFDDAIGRFDGCEVNLDEGFGARLTLDRFDG